MSKPIQNENPHHIEREFALDVVKKLVEKGHTALFAGGCVRDELLGLVPQKPFIKVMQPQTVEAEDSQYQPMGEKPKWSRPGHVIERNLEASGKK